MKYSVIIPVYNAEKTINRCLDSLLSRAGDDAELILINDGSKDDSDAVCKNYCKKYNNIRYFYKENGGVSTARNMGLSEATGDYVLFVDSDDYVSDNYFSVIDSIIEQESDVDLILYGHKNSDSENGVSCEPFNLKGDIEISEKVSELLPAGPMYSLCSKVFKRDIISQLNLRFREKIDIGEDIEFIFQYLLKVGKMISVSDILYQVVLENTDSLSRKRRDYVADHLLQVNKTMLEALKNSDLSSPAKAHYQKALSWMFYRSVYSAAKELQKFDYSAKERRREIKRVCRMYAAEKVKPIGLKCKLFALPVRYKLSFILDFLFAVLKKVR